MTHTSVTQNLGQTPKRGHMASKVQLGDEVKVEFCFQAMGGRHPNFKSFAVYLYSI